MVSLASLLLALFLSSVYIKYVSSQAAAPLICKKKAEQEWRPPATSAARTNWCEPGIVIPLTPLPSCRTYMVRRACGVSTGPPIPVPVLKARCCAELEQIVPYCRCGALKIMMEEVLSGGWERRLTCSLEGLQQFAPTLVSEMECNLMTIHGRPFCYALEDEGTSTD